MKNLPGFENLAGVFSEERSYHERALTRHDENEPRSHSKNHEDFYDASLFSRVFACLRGFIIFRGVVMSVCSPGIMKNLPGFENLAGLFSEEVFYG